MSAARAMAFNRPPIQIFFDTLEMILQKEQIDFHRINNMDESGLSKVQRSSKIFAKTGRKQVESLASADVESCNMCLLHECYRQFRAASSHFS